MDNYINEENELIKAKYEKLQQLKEDGKDPHKVSKYDKSHNSSEIKENFEKLEGESVKIAGRLMSKRIQGKAGFIDIQDQDGRIQAYVRKDRLGEEEFAAFKLLDIGDIIGLEGEVFKTKVGEVSVKATGYTLLTKSIQILPEKFHGLKDVDLRFRQRYVDLIVNPEVKDAFVKRSKIIKTIRSILDGKGYLEVDTPTLSSVAGGATAKPFITHHNTLDIDMYMRIANELYLKRLIVGGFEGVYEMGKMFRNEGMSIKHNPEYTAMEVYVAYKDYEFMMDLTEELITECCKNVNDGLVINYQGRELDLTPPWKRVSMHEMVKEKTGVDFYNLDEETARKEAKRLNLEIKPHFTIGHYVNEAFETYCEDDLIQPTFLMHHPVEVSPLAKRNKDDDRITDRFELFINGWELANAFSELNDAIDQRSRFEQQLKQREAGDEEAHQMDEDFINALMVGLPPTGGLGIGIDRMIMLLTDSASIRDVILFPTMKPLTE